MRLAALVASILLAVASVGYYAYDARRRGPAEEFIKKYTVELRRPISAEESRYTLTFDAANEVLATAAVDDALGTINFNDFNDEERRAWIESVARVSQENTDAQKLQLDAIAARPGWPLHYLRLGQLSFAQVTTSSNPISGPQKWLVPLELSIASAPGHDRAVAFLTAALLQFSPLLPAAQQDRLPRYLPRAFEDPSFVRRSFTRAAAILGNARTAGMVPRRAANLSAALNATIAARDIETASMLLPQWEREEIAARTVDLAELARVAEGGDVAVMKSTADNWLSEHRVSDFGSPAAEQQLLRLLNLYPHAVPGTWESDPRANVVRYFTDGRMRGPGREVLAPTVNVLADTPVPVAARATIAAGDLFAAETLHRQSGSAGGFEWTPALVELSEAHLSAGHFDNAREALMLVSPSAREECDVLLARRRLAVAASDVPTQEAISRSLGELPRKFEDDSWSDQGEVSMCIDPTLLKARRVVVDIATAEPLLVDYGWDAARSGTLLVKAPGAKLTMPIDDREGRHTLWVRNRLGEDLVLRRQATLE